GQPGDRGAAGGGFAGQGPGRGRPADQTPQRAQFPVQQGQQQRVTAEAAGEERLVGRPGVRVHALHEGRQLDVVAIMPSPDAVPGAAGRRGGVRNRCRGTVRPGSGKGRHGGAPCGDGERSPPKVGWPAVQWEDNEPGAQTGRPGAVGPVRGLLGGTTSPAAFVSSVVAYFPASAGTSNTSPRWARRRT